MVRYHGDKMQIAPLALVVLLGYGLLIAIALTTWTAVAYFREDTTDDGGRPEPKPIRTPQERSAAKRAVSNDEVRGARSRRARSGSDPFHGESKPAPAGEVASSGRSGAVAWKPEPAAKRSTREDEAEEDAFERFLKSRPDDFDLR